MCVPVPRTLSGISRPFRINRQIKFSCTQGYKYASLSPHQPLFFQGSILIYTLCHTWLKVYALNKAGWPLVFYLNFCQQCPDNPAHFTQTTICLWRMLSCCVGCRICSCVLVFNSAFCFATFPCLLCPLESMRGGRTLQLLHLQSSAEGSQWLLLCSEVSYQLQFRAAGREAVEISTMVIQCYEVLSPSLLRKHEWNTICWLHTYISCNLSMMLWKEKNSTSQGHDAAKYEACYSHLHGSPECFPASALLNLPF